MCIRYIQRPEASYNPSAPSFQFGTCDDSHSFKHFLLQSFAFLPTETVFTFVEIQVTLHQHSQLPNPWNLPSIVPIDLKNWATL